MKSFHQQVRDAIKRLEAKDGFDGTLTKQAVIDETQDYYKGAYRLDSLRLFRAVSSALREEYLSKRDGKAWLWMQRDASEGQDWRESAEATGTHCKGIRKGGDNNADDKVEIAESVERGIGWRVVAKLIRQRRRKQRQ